MGLVIGDKDHAVAFDKFPEVEAIFLEIEAIVEEGQGGIQDALTKADAEGGKIRGHLL